MSVTSEHLEPSFSGSPEIDKLLALNGLDADAAMEVRRLHDLGYASVCRIIDRVHDAATKGQVYGRAMLDVAANAQRTMADREYIGAVIDTTHAEALAAYEADRAYDPMAPIDEWEAIEWLDTPDPEDLNEVAA